ncbi:Slam-dependent surface lipoprotein [Mannheimia massilioguelmaensis]|uniref:Slam-dependent surface lipoprotein n=1 Tax=Mannheimia massilioguelmaensis TaxID=1604354 RepID=UPI0005CB3677|nr:Slam-dependent surface lipoprotein [Mannheimia massilioguelmaensis]
MKFQHTLIAVLFLSTAAFAQATVTGMVASTDKSHNKTINIATDEGKAALKVNYSAISKDKNNAVNKEQAFSTMAQKADKWISKLSGTAVRDGNGVVVAKLYKIPTITSKMPEHKDLGRMSFKQVGNMDVWYGDWADVPHYSKDPAKEGKNYSVYYAGSETVTMPQSGKANYDVKGINNYVNANTEILKGNLTADFTEKTLKGSIASSKLAINMDAKIKNSAIDGNAVANGKDEGKLSGHFYGNNAAGLAGIAEFSKKPSLNTAFGGTKK